VRWEVVVLRKESPGLVGVIGEPISGKLHANAERVQEAAIRGLQALSRGPERMKHYSEAALIDVKYLANQVKALGDVKVYVGNAETERQAIVGHSTLKNINELIGVKYESQGSVVGHLDAITVHKRDEFRVWDENTARPVTCGFARKLEDTIKSLLRRKVTVYGELHSNRRGEPVFIRVEGIEPMRSREELPSIEEMSGLVDDMTQGKTLKDYLEDIRNE
jgi:hypothetical protein